MSESNPYHAPPQQQEDRESAKAEDSRAEGFAFRAGGVLLIVWGGFGVASWLMLMAAVVGNWITPPLLHLFFIVLGVLLWNRGTLSLHPEGTTEQRAAKRELQQVVLSILEQHEVDESVEMDKAYAGLPLKELVRIYESINRDAYPEQTKKLIRALKARHEHALSAARSREDSQRDASA